MVEMYGKRFQKNISIKQNIIFQSEDIKIRIVKLVRIFFKLTEGFFLSVPS